MEGGPRPARFFCPLFIVSVYTQVSEDTPMTTAPDLLDSDSAVMQASLAAAVARATEAVLILGPDWRLLHANPVCRKLLDLGEPGTGELLAGRLDPARFQELQAHLAQGQPWEGALGFRRQDGFSCSLVGSFTPILDSRGRVRALVGVLKDAGAELERERSLRQTQKMESLGTLAGGIAHDFNNILSAILGAAELMHLQLKVDSQLRPALEIIYQAGRRARELNKQILTFSRSGQDQQVPFDLSQLVREALSLLKASLPKNVEVQACVAASIWTVGDSNQIHQVIMNLAINAYHALGTEGGDLQIELREQQLLKEEPLLPPGRYAELSIRDGGCGMTSDVMEKIFEPFFTTKAVREGTGLGLAVVHGIVHKHHGSIEVSSSLGAGSVFRVLLPACPAQILAAGAPDQPDERGNERILLVDDEDIVAALAKQGLQELGYRVTAKTSSKDALEAFLAHPEAFDVLVTDLAMANLSGAQLTSQLQAIRPNLPAILVTGVVQPGSLSLDPAAHFEEVLRKPLVAAELAQAVRRVMAPQTASRGLSPAKARPIILLAEDNRETRTMLRVCLVRGGYEVREARDGQDAWESFQAAAPGTFSLVMTDILMPHMDGLSLVGRIRQLEPGLPVVILSTSDDPDSVRNALNLRVSAYLNKPVDPMALLECVQQHLSD